MEQLIEKFISGKSTKEEANQVAKYFEKNPKALETYFPTDKIFEKKKENLDEATSKRILDKIRLYVYHTKEEQYYINNRKTKLWWAAAILFIIGGVGTILFLNNNNNATDMRIATKAGNISITEPKQRIVEIVNTENKTMHLVLTDGSKVELYAQSSLRYDTSFLNNTRSIELTGSAMFDVVKDKDKPFKVSTAGYRTVVLGTKFLIKTDFQKHAISVRLYSGKVQIEKEEGTNFETQELEPGQELYVDLRKNIFTKTDFLKKEEVNEKEETVNKEEIEFTSMQFHQTPLPAVLQAIENNYGIEIKYNASDISGLLFTGTFKEGTSIEVILNRLADLYSLSFNKKGAAYEIKK